MDFRKVTKKIRIWHILFSLIVICARFIHQVPILIENFITGSDISRPKKRDITGNSKISPCDISFADNEWVNFQMIIWGYKDKWFKQHTNITDDLSNIEQNYIDKFSPFINPWANKYFDEDANIRIWYGTTTQLLDWINIYRPNEIIKGKSHITFILPKQSCLVSFLDHYCCDGGVLFDYFVRLGGDYLKSQKYPKFPSYTYIPLITDSLTTEMVFRNLVELYSYPSQIKHWSPYLSQYSFKLNKNDKIKWNRWNNYAECILRLFDRFNGDTEALGKIVYKSNLGNDIVSKKLINVPQYLRVGVNVGIKTDYKFGNNRIGCIPLRITNPTDNCRQARIENIANQFKFWVEENSMDSISTYDVVRGFDIGWIRNYLTSDAIDVLLTSFMLDSVDNVDYCFGGFFGKYNKPFIYVNSGTGGNISCISYTTNLF